MIAERSRMAQEETAQGTKSAFASQFAAAFSSLRPAILAEWSALDATTLGETAGEFDKVVSLVAERTAHTKALVRKQLEELYRVVTQPVEKPRRARPAHDGEVGAHLDQLIEEFERRTAHIIRELRGGFFSEARERVRGNVLFSLLVTLGLGFIVGVLFSSSNRGK